MKFNFGKILVHKEASEEYFCRIGLTTLKSGTVVANIHFNKSFLIESNLNNKIVEFLADPNKEAIAFRALGMINKDEINKATMKLITVSKNGNAVVGFTRIMQSLKFPIANYKCPIKQYDDDVYGKVFYFQLNKETRTKNVSAVNN